MLFHDNNLQLLGKTVSMQVCGFLPWNRCWSVGEGSIAPLKWLSDSVNLQLFCGVGGGGGGGARVKRQRECVCVTCVKTVHVCV